jgi:hypothetical protein
MLFRRAVVLGIWLAGASLHAQTDPGWWTPGVIGTGTANSYAPINLGQLMNLADQARIHLDTEAGAAGGAGPDIENMVAAWPDAPATAYSPANLGQLKAIADAFYTRLDALGFDYQTQINNNSFGGTWTGTPLRPWIDTTPAATNYAIANIGQAKLLFSWDLTKGLLHAISATMPLDEDTVGTITLGCLGAGTGGATYQILTGPSHGTAVLNGSVVDYYPNTHYNGNDSFVFQATKGGQISTATISIVVTPVDDPPLVSVGGGQTVTLPGTLGLSASITDIDTVANDISHTWVKVSGPGTVTFADASALSTTATFSEAGDYLLRLVASDMHSVSSDSLLVSVNPAGATPPTVTMLSLSGGYPFGSPITLQATATVGSGATITKVEFYEGSRKLGEVTTPVSSPMSGLYQLSWTPTHLGAYAISAIATSSTGAKSFSTNSVVARATEGQWFSGTGAGNEGYSGTGGNGGAIADNTTGPAGSYASGSGGNGGGGAAGAGGNGTGNAAAGLKDSDGDGIVDADDAYPRDPRRYKDVPVINYAAIDLSDAVQAGNNIEDVAIGDNGQVAFSFWSNNTDYRVGKWKDGAMIAPPQVTGSSRTDGDITKPTESKINSSGSIVFPDGSSWFYGTTGDFPAGFFGPVFALTESNAVFGNAGSEYALVPVGSPYDYTDHFDIKKSITGGETTWTSITSQSASRNGKLLMSVNFEYFGPPPLSQPHSDNDLVFHYAGGNATIDSCDAGAGLSFLVESVNSYGQATYRRNPIGSDLFFSGGAIKNVETEKSQDYLLQVAQESLPLVLDNLLIRRWGYNLEGPDLGVWVERQFLYDTNPANADSNGKWPLYAAHFPDGWSDGKITNAASLPHSGEARINIKESNTSGVLVAKAYKTIDAAGNFIPEANQRLHALMLLPVEILDKDKKIITAPKVAKMADAGAINTGVSPATINIDKDTDRFYVRLKGCASFGSGAIKVGTVDNPDKANYDDSGTELDLKVDGDDLITDTLMLVSDEIDDLVPVDGVSDNAPKNDRTFRIQLGGKFQIKNIKLNGVDFPTDLRIVVPAKKELDFTVVMVKDGSGNAPTQSIVDTCLKDAAERYAQVGVKLNWKFQPASQPSGVNLIDGLSMSGTNMMDPEEVALLNGLATGSPKDMQIFIVNNLDAGPGTTLFGKSYPDFSSAGTRYVYSVIINHSQLSTNRGRYTIAHEIGHVLTNDGHYGGQMGTLTDEQKRNLMARGMDRNTTLDLVGGRRLVESQQFNIQNHSLCVTPKQ